MKLFVPLGGHFMQPREHPRHSLALSAKLLFGEQAVGCEICDISPGGAKIRVGLALDHGTPVTLSVDPFGAFAGTTAWNQREFLGLRFGDDPGKIAEILAAMAIYSGG